MNPGEQRSHQRVTDGLDRRLDDLETIVPALDERIALVSKQTHERISDHSKEMAELFALSYRRIVELDRHRLDQAIVFRGDFKGRCHLLYRVIRWFFTGQEWRK